MIVGRFLGSQLRLVILRNPGLQGRSDGRIADEVSEASVLVMPGLESPFHRRFPIICKTYILHFT